jgi:hypothetical protein
MCRAYALRKLLQPLVLHGTLKNTKVHSVGCLLSQRSFGVSFCLSRPQQVEKTSLTLLRSGVIVSRWTLEARFLLRAEYCY